MRHLSAALAPLLGIAIAAAANAYPSNESDRTSHPGPLTMHIVDRDRGVELPLIAHRGNRYLAGEPGHRYAVRLQNNSAERVLVVLSIDGVNAVSGETASASQRGYVLEPWQRSEISGWRKNLSEVAQFVFTDLDDSYAARTGRPHNVGVIGAAVFRERMRPRSLLPQTSPALAGRTETVGTSAAGASAADTRADAAPSASARQASVAAEAAPQLGTGHGSRAWEPVTTTAFERASGTPQQVLALYYDSRPRLIARGIIDPPAWSTPVPQPFPIGYVPDPR